MKDAYGRLSLLGKERKRAGKKEVWCRCVCGSKLWVNLSHLKSGHTKSCGCLSREKNIKRLTTHGGSKHPLYSRWIELISRCENENNTDYEDYGGRGVTVTPRWSDPETGFHNFLTDMELSWEEGLTIDRIDPNKGYSKENCRWITMAEQQRNKTTNHFKVESAEYKSWYNMKRKKGSYVFKWNKFKKFLADMGEKPEGTRLRRRDRMAPHGPDNSYWG